MKKLVFWKAFLVCLAVFLSTWQSQADVARVVTPAKSVQGRQFKLMSTFLSNFTEVRLYDFDLKKSGDDNLLHLGDPSDPHLIRFGIWHNYVNNYQTRIKPCPVKGCKHGSLVIEAKYAAESVKKFFDIDLKHRSVEASDQPYFDPYYFDGKYYHFEGADGDPAYFARVEQATKEGGVVRMTGYIYNGEDENERTRTFEATARPYTWKGVKTWAILSMKTREISAQ